MSALDGKALLEHGEVIARRYAGRVGADVAEEIRAEAVLRALRSPAPDGRIEPWLERIYKNLLIDRWRRAERLTVSADALDSLSATASPEDLVLANERRRLVRASLRRLPRDARRVLLSRYYAELDESATSQRCNIAGATVRTRVHRALARLRSWLGDLRSFVPFFGRAAGQVSMVGAAPVLVAALMIAGSGVPEAMVIATAPVAEHSTTSSFVRTEIHATAPTVAMPAQAHPGKKPAALPPVLAQTNEPQAAVVPEILWPESMVVFAEPEMPAPPCMVEPPATFALQIEKMVEDEL